MIKNNFLSIMYLTSKRCSNTFLLFLLDVSCHFCVRIKIKDMKVTVKIPQKIELWIDRLGKFVCPLTL